MDSVAGDYQQKADFLAQETKILQDQVNRYSLFRLGIFLLFILGVYIFFNSGPYAISTIAFLSLISFLFLVKAQINKQHQLTFKNHKLTLIQNEIATFKNHSNIYNDGSSFIDAKHPYSDDLDIYGKESLFHFINRCSSESGIGILASWLKQAASKNQIICRQEAVQELQAYPEESLNFRTTLYPLDKSNLLVLSSFLSNGLNALLAFLQNKIVQYLILILPY